MNSRPPHGLQSSQVDAGEVMGLRDNRSSKKITKLKLTKIKFILHRTLESNKITTGFYKVHCLCKTQSPILRLQHHLPESLLTYDILVIHELLLLILVISSVHFNDFIQYVTYRLPINGSYGFKTNGIFNTVLSLVWTSLRRSILGCNSPK